MAVEDTVIDGEKARCALTPELQGLVSLCQ